MTLRIHLLGQVCLESDDVVVPATALPGRQGRMAFAYLALARHPVSRDELAEVIWPDELPRSWERDLSAVISKLKAPLTHVGAPDAVRSALGCYELVLPPGATIDVESARVHVEEAEAALRRDEPAVAWGAASTAFNLATRPFLPGESGEWVEARRSELGKVAVRAADALVVVESSRGGWAEAVRFAEEAITREPYRESGHAALVDVHVAAGNRAEALRAYERARTLLVEALGVSPSATLEAAYRRALEADAPPAAGAVPVTGTVSLLFTDLVGSTELAERVGADASETLRREHFRLLRDAVATTGGNEVKNLGDGLMIAFARARDALSCAVAMQEAVDRRNRTADGPSLAIRVGVHVGEPVIDEGDYFGMPVVIAKRLCDAAEPSEILASELACTVAGAGDAFDLGPPRPLELKGVDEAVTARAIRWAPIDDAPLPVPAAIDATRGGPLAFVGREREVASILARVPVEPVLVRVVLVAGEPGVGKTRLLAEVGRRAHEKGAAVLWGRSVEDTTVAYQPLVEALDHVVAETSLHELRALTGRGTGDLSILLPRLASRLPVGRSAVDEPDRALVFDAVAGMLHALAARRTVVVLLDDFHWADAPSAQLLVHLASAADVSSVVVVAAARSAATEWSAAALDAYAELVRLGRVDRLELDGLDERDIPALLGMDDARLHPEGFALARSLHAATAGNPFFVGEMLRHLQETGRVRVEEGRWAVEPLQSLDVPSGVVAVVGRRLARLTDDARELLALASVVGIEFDLDVLVELQDESDDDVLRRLEQAVAAQVVHEIGGAVDRFAFTHALVREAVLVTVGASRRRRLHRRVAEALERLGPETRVAEIAHHWCAAGPSGDLARALDWARRAGNDAMAKLAYEQAATHYDAALEALRAAGAGADELDLTLALADARARASDPRTTDAYRAAIDLARACGDAIRFARAVIGLTREWILTGLVDAERIGLIEEAIGGLGDADVPERATLLGQLAGELYYAGGSESRRRALADEAVSIGRRLDDPVVLGQALDHRCYATWDPSIGGAHLEAGREIVELARRSGSVDLELRGHDWVMIAAASLADIGAYDDALDAYERIAEGLRRPRLQWYARTRRAGRLALAGDLDAAARLAKLARDEGYRIGEADALGVFAGGMWAVWLERPNDESLHTHLAILEQYSSASGFDDDALPVLIHRAMHGVLSALLGDIDTAAATMAWYRSYGLTSLPRHYGWGITMSTLCRLAALAGTDDDAAVLYTAVKPFDGQLVPTAGSLWCGAWSHMLGLLAAKLGALDDAQRHLGDARALYERVGAKAFLARAERDLGGVLLAAGNDDEGRAVLAAAATAASSLGLPLIADDCQNLL